MKHGPQIGFRFDLSGGHIALDFANTISRRDDPERRRDHLPNPAELVSFAVQDGILSPKQANELRPLAGKSNVAALRHFREAIALRESVYRVFAAIARKKSASEADVQAINDHAVEASKHRRLARLNGSYRWEWDTNAKSAVERILWPIAEAAADLLTSDELKLVRWCEAPDCEWLFLDHSRNRSRRWCDMTSCGNRAKARRHYQRSRE